MTPTPPPEEPLAVMATDGAEAPPDAKYRVVLNGQTAFFTGHTAAFRWQGEHGGKLRTV